MEKIIIGNINADIDYLFREVCFGIVYKNNKYYCTKKRSDISLIGGGIEKGESDEETLKREFLEEAGLTITGMKELCLVDCFWLTRKNVNMETLAKFYVVDVDDKIEAPLEVNHELVLLTEEELRNSIELPYQIKALEEYFKSYSNNK